MCVHYYFLNLYRFSEEQLVEKINDSKLQVENETHFCEFVIRWMKAQKKEFHLERILSIIRWCSYPKKYKIRNTKYETFAGKWPWIWRSTVNNAGDMLYTYVITCGMCTWLCKNFWTCFGVHTSKATKLLFICNPADKLINNQINKRENS